MTVTPSDTPARAAFLRQPATDAHSWENQDRSAIVRRYDRLARYITLIDWLFFIPPTFRRHAVEWLNLKPGERVLEIGCGTGRNLPFLRSAVGASGHVYGVDISAGMLAKARELTAQNHWPNVGLVEQDAAEFAPPEPLDAVVFGFSYNTMPHHQAVLRHAWSLLRPGGRLVIMDGKLPPGLGGRLILPFSLWLMKRTMLGNPLLRPWEDLERLAGDIEMEQFGFGTWYVCRATKQPAAATVPAVAETVV